jgi:hypothetical protein
MSDQIEMHDNCECVIVHPTGQLQNVRECWCKVYHVFGQNIQMEEIGDRHVIEDIHCYYVKDGVKYNFPPNMYLERKFGKKICGAGIFYRKGGDVSLEKAKMFLIQ